MARPRADARRRRLTRLRLEHDVGLRHDPHRSAFGIHDSEGTDMVLRKQTLYLLEVGVRRDGDHITRHDIAHGKAQRSHDGRISSHWFLPLRDPHQNRVMAAMPSAAESTWSA